MSKRHEDWEVKLSFEENMVIKFSCSIKICIKKKKRELGWRGGVMTCVREP